MIVFSSVTFRYASSSEPALEGISLRIETGQVVVLSGRSGCGKSTLINLVNGLLPKHPDDDVEGLIKVDGNDVAALESYELAERIGSVFQNPKSQFFNLDTDSEVAFGLENAGIPNPELQTRVTETIERVGIQDLSGRSIFELSGGQKQRVAIAGAYALGPDIFVLDEPSANLDHQATAHLTSVLKELKAEGKTIIVSEHRLGYLADLADRYLILDEGRIVGDYTASAFAALTIEERHAYGLRALSLEEATQHTPTPPPDKHCCYDHITPPSSTPVIDAEGVTVAFGERVVLDNVDLQLNPGEIVGLIGVNGAGKTTLVRTLCGLQKPSGGKFSLSGQTVIPKALRGKAFLIMQDVNSQLFGETVAEECTLGLEHIPDATVNQVLETLGLLPFRERHPLSLSGGQKQRVAVAAGLCSSRSLLIFDEPTSGLDRESMLAMSDLIRGIAAEGASVLIVSHDVEFLANSCTRILELHRGRLVEEPKAPGSISTHLRAFFKV